MRDLKYMTVVAVAAVGLALAGCGSDGGPSQASLDAERAMVMQLQGQIAALRAQLGLPADGNIGGSIEDLQNQVASLQQRIDDAAEAARMAAEEAARMAAAKTGKDLFAALAGTAKPTAAIMRWPTLHNRQRCRRH